jgi:HupF/HypC family
MTSCARPAGVAPTEPRRPVAGDATCITCADAARRMRVLEVDEREALAVCVDEQDRPRTVDTGIVGSVAPGDTLLVHAGTALVRERP